ncbi:hypothetical protein KFL_002470190 [Klebsormidium nitens]|uniref:Uncharacterized protein n=1 Tax=Klebsormidium nitens TaxID=105231 RepID=A0A1Y1I3Z8_KLENI|nr:hypothetical protein KFL_002470190 [Klebsormidium nitens]|eukprot:GAQ85660.1 hypothetical protein KFL_002470190 [Klebsormidium nitens]
MASANAARTELLTLPALALQMEVDQLRSYLPAVVDEIARQKGPIRVEDSATGGLKLAKDIFTEKISDNDSLQTVVVGLKEGYNQYVRDDPSSGEKVSWKRTFGVSRCQDLGQKRLPDAVDFFLRKAASSRELCAAMKAYLDGYFCLPGTAACNTATRARLEACFAHILAAFEASLPTRVPNGEAEGLFFDSDIPFIDAFWLEDPGSLF